MERITYYDLMVAEERMLDAGTAEAALEYQALLETFVAQPVWEAETE